MGKRKDVRISRALPQKFLKIKKDLEKMNKKAAPEIEIVCTKILNSVFKDGNFSNSCYWHDSLVGRLTLVCKEFDPNSKVLNTQTDSEIIKDYKSVKIKLRISFIFLEFEI